MSVQTLVEMLENNNHLKLNVDEKNKKKLVVDKTTLNNDVTAKKELYGARHTV